MSYEGEGNKENRNEVMSIMGGFEIMNEMEEMIEVGELKKVWVEDGGE